MTRKGWKFQNTPNKMLQTTDFFTSVFITYKARATRARSALRCALQQKGEIH